MKLFVWFKKGMTALVMVSTTKQTILISRHTQQRVFPLSWQYHWSI